MHSKQLIVPLYYCVVGVRALECGYVVWLTNGAYASVMWCPVDNYGGLLTLLVKYQARARDAQNLIGRLLAQLVGSLTRAG